MVRDGIQKKLRRIRPPHVQTSYDLQVGDTIEREELPFALDQMNDGVVRRCEPPSSFRDRRFVEVTLHNFDRVRDSRRPQSAIGMQDGSAEALSSDDPPEN